MKKNLNETIQILNNIKGWGNLMSIKPSFNRQSEDGA